MKYWNTIKAQKTLYYSVLRQRGEYLAQRIQQKIQQIEEVQIPTGAIDITSFRDDIDSRQQQDAPGFNIDTDLNHQVVIIVDDVLYTGRTVRASLDAILLHARPKRLV